MLDSNCRYPYIPLVIRPPYERWHVVHNRIALFATFSERVKSAMSIERCKISIEAITCQNLIRERFKVERRLALNQSRSSTGTSSSRNVQSIFARRRQREATFLRCGISHAGMIDIYILIHCGIEQGR